MKEYKIYVTKPSENIRKEMYKYSWKIDKN